MQHTLLKIKHLLLSSEVLILNTGAGMSADSGIPTYRGEGGSWGKVESEFNRNVTEIMTPQFILENPVMMWKRFCKGHHRLKETAPHDGYFILKNWLKSLELDHFVITSNVDRQFCEAGFDPELLYEVHGASGFLQCTLPCWDKVWQSDYSIYHYVAELTLDNLPTCPNCGALVRPNIYIFKDRTFVPSRIQAQRQRWEAFLQSNQHKKMLVLEIGAGPTIKTIRHISRQLKNKYQAQVVRINPHDAEIEAPGIALPMSALDALRSLDELIRV
ncbi:MAG: Sir2 family NAD-dependent protein deacetylase [Microscillaceae bacterium]|nr:Sir2 family NAD-dependent protein deacetylase [Microscillaceae bacterium]